LYFCYTMIVQIFRPHVLSEKDISRLFNTNDLKKYFINGFGLALSSPTAIIWFATVGGSVIATQTLHNKFDLTYFFGGFFTSSISWSLMLAFISYKGGQLMKNQIKKIFSIASAIIFLILAIYLFLDGFKTLIK
jgi:L-lysine exporter family protein LysE/ArgO